MKARFVISLFLLIPLVLAACSAPPVPTEAPREKAVEREAPVATEAPASADAGRDRCARPRALSHKTPSWHYQTQPRDG